METDVKIDTYIKLDETPTPEDSINLEELAELIEDSCKLAAKREKKPPKIRSKDGGLTIGLTVVGLVISAVGTLVSVLSYWKSQQPKYSLTVIIGDTTLSIENTSIEEIKEAISKLKSKSTNSQIEVRISK